jgi:adenosine deaminase
MTSERYELHCHLDGSVRPDTIAELAVEAGIELAGPVRARVVAPPDVGSLHAFLSYLDVALDVLQTPSALQRAARELVQDWYADGVAYGEARFAPQLHGRLGMSVDEAVTAVDAGLREGYAATGVRTALLLCCLRHQSPEVSLRVADAAVRFARPANAVSPAAGTAVSPVAGTAGPVVAGLDLAGDERLPGAPHRGAFDLAHAAGVPVTVHAGEAAGPASVWEAIDVLGARRIGHGVRCVTDPALVARLRTDRIALETCPRSNVLTRAVNDLTAHPVDRLLRAGLRVTVSTDGRTTADTTLEQEFADLRRVFGWTAEQEERCRINAADAAFAVRDPLA